MKKSLASLSVISLLSVSMLASCAEGYTYRDGYMLSLNGVDYTAEQLFDSYGLDTQAGVKAYYQAIDNISIEATIGTTDEMKTVVNNNIEKFKETAENSAKQNGTSYDEELEAALKGENCDDLTELSNKYLLQTKTTKRNTDYYSDDNYAQMTSSFVDKLIPYHVKHVLVNVDATGNSVSTISEANAKKLYSVVSRLADDNDTFGNVALQSSDDSSSAVDYGDLQVLSKKTEFVPEFKYNVYTYDALFNNNVISKGDVVTKALGSNYTEYTNFLDGKAYGIPYSALTQLNKYSDVTKDKNNLTVDNAGEINYPRNVIFNNYLNNHGLSFIYLDNSTVTASASDSALASIVGSTKWVANSTIVDNLVSYTEVNNGNYKHQTGVSSVSDVYGKKILCDEEGNPILVSRAGTSAYQGVHFVVIKKSPFVETKSDLVKYYTIDKTISYSTRPTYINSIQGTRSDLNDRVENDSTGLKKKIAATDSNIDITIFNDTLSKASAAGLTINDNIKKQLKSYTDSTIATTLEAESRTYNESWTNFLYLLTVAKSSSATKVIPLSGIDAFMNGSDTFKAYVQDRAGI